jgi:hypothetical protein
LRDAGRSEEKRKRGGREREEKRKRNGENGESVKTVKV